LEDGWSAEEALKKLEIRSRGASGLGAIELAAKYGIASGTRAVRIGTPSRIGRSSIDPRLTTEAGHL